MIFFWIRWSELLTKKLFVFDLSRNGHSIVSIRFSTCSCKKLTSHTLFPYFPINIGPCKQLCVCVSFYSIWNGRKSEIEQLKTTTAIAQQLAASLYHAIRYRYCCCCSPFNQVRPIMWEWKRVSDIFFRSLPDIPYSFYLFRAQKKARDVGCLAVGCSR